MDNKSFQQPNVKLITRSTSKNSVDHRKIVNFLENLSKDKDGAPVRWSFTKSGIHKAKGVRKKIALRVGKKVEKIPSNKKVVVKKLSSSSQKSFKLNKPKKDSSLKTNPENMSDIAEKTSTQSENLVVSIERLNSSVELNSKSSLSDSHSKQTEVIKRKVGRPKTSTVSKVSDEQSKAVTGEFGQSESKDVSNDVGIVKRGPGRPKKNSTWTSLNQKIYSNVVKKAVNTGVKANLTTNVDDENYDSSSSISSAVDSQKKKSKSVNRQGIKLGPKRLLRSQDNLITRQKGGKGFMPGPGKKRKRTLSGEFHLLEEPTRKKRPKIPDGENEVFDTDVKVIKITKVADIEHSQNSNESELLKSEVNRKRKQASENNLVGKQSVGSNYGSLVHSDSVKKKKVKPSKLSATPVTSVSSAESQCGSGGKESFSSILDTGVQVKKRGPGRPKSSDKLKKLSTTFSPSVDQKTNAKKVEKPQEKHQDSSSSSTTVKRTLKIVGPGGVKFTKATLQGHTHSMPVKKDIDNKQNTPSLQVKENETGIMKQEDNKVLFGDDGTKSDDAETKPGNILDKIMLPKENDNVSVKAEELGIEEVLVKEINFSVKDVPMLEIAKSIPTSHIDESFTVCKSVESGDYELLQEKTDNESKCKSDYVEKDNSNEESVSKFDIMCIDDNNRFVTVVKNQEQEIIDFHSKSESKVDFVKNVNYDTVRINSSSKEISSEIQIDSQPDLISQKQVFSSMKDDALTKLDTKKTESTVSKINNDLCDSSSVKLEEKSEAVFTEVNADLKTVTCSDISSEEQTDTSKVMQERKSYIEESESNKECDLIDSVNDVQVDNKSLCNTEEEHGNQKFSNEDVNTQPIPEECVNSGSAESSVGENMLGSEEGIFLGEKGDSAVNRVSLTVDREKTEKETVSNSESVSDLHQTESLVQSGLDVKEPSVLDIEKEGKHDSNSLQDSDTQEVSTESKVCSGNEKDNSKNSATKRVFQLRKKASRSPLEIIAMRQSIEERQYMLELTKKAMRREKRISMMRNKMQNSLEDKLQEKVQPDKVQQDKIQQDKVQQDTESDNFDIEKQCKPCSVVLIDFVKYLKEQQTSYHSDAISTDNEDSELVDSGEINNSADIQSELETLPEKIEQKDNTDVNALICSSDTAMETTKKLCDVTGQNNSKEDEKVTGKPLVKVDGRKKRKPSARKQMKSYSYSSNLTAEIMPNTEEESESKTTVPPLRLKITGQEILTKHTVPPLKLKLNQKPLCKVKVNKQEKGPPPVRRRKARKGLSPVKQYPGSLKELNKIINDTEFANNTRSTKTPGFESSVGNVSGIETSINRGTDTNLMKEVNELGTDIGTIEDLGKMASESVEHPEQILLQAPSETPVTQAEEGVNYETEFVCKTCEFITPNRTIMESHIYVHLKNVPFKCVHCQRIFRSRGVAFIHMRSVHPDQEARMETAEDIDEREYYKEVRKPKISVLEPPTFVQTSLQQSQDSVIISVVLPRNVAESTGRYCCSYCTCTSSSQQDILDHINSQHRHDIQYTCSICDKAVFGYKEGIAQHFADVHPGKPVMYKSMPDFYDRRGSVQTVDKLNVVGSQDKGNIFDRMNDLFSGNSGNTTAETPPDTGVARRNSFPEKTSAEADSTTTDNDEIDSDKTNNEKDKSFPSSVVPSIDEQTKITEDKLQHEVADNSVKEVDGIEELAKFYNEAYNQNADENQTNIINQVANGQIMSVQSSSEVDENQKEDSTITETENDMGLKIIDVVSLRDQVTDSAGGALALETWGEEILQTNSEILTDTGQNVSKDHVEPTLVKDSVSAVPLNIPNPAAKATFPAVSRVSSNLGDISKTAETTATTYKCERCCVHAPMLSVMVEHLRSSHKDISRLFLCPFCRQYEGSTEPDIHRHIKQFHNNPNQKSPPVALSSAAKKHLRTIQVPVGDSVKSTDGKATIDKDIYKCLKCQKHMPSLDYIYDHLEKEHNEVFVYVCPDCKKFRAKEEEVVYNHIKVAHQKNTDNIVLSLAIEENLFTRVQSLMKEKSGQSKSLSANKVNSGNPQSITQQQQQQQQQQPLQQTVIRHTPPTQMVPRNNQNDVIVVGELNFPVPGYNQGRPFPGQRLPVRMQSQVLHPVIPTSLPIFQSPVINQGFAARQPPPAHSVYNQVTPNQTLSKSALRKSRPVQIRQHLPDNTQMTFSMPSSVTNIGSSDLQTFQQQSLQQSQKSQESFQSPSGPPPLIRGPPPLLRFDPVSVASGSSIPNPAAMNSSKDHQRHENLSQDSGVRHASFSMTDRLHRLHGTPAGGPVQSPEPASREPDTTPSGRTLLKVPSINTVHGSPRPMSASSAHGEGRRSVDPSDGSSTPLDLSKGYSSDDSQKSASSKQTADDEVDEIPPDAFQIFNLRPAAPPQPANRPPLPPANIMPYPFQRSGQQPMYSGIRAAMVASMTPRSSGQMMQNRSQRPPPYMPRGMMRQTYRGPNSQIGSVTAYQRSPTSSPRPVGQGPNATPQNMADMANLKVFKCPYCPNVVPLSMRDVSPHIEKFHPGHSILFVKRDA